MFNFIFCRGEIELFKTALDNRESVLENQEGQIPPFSIDSETSGGLESELFEEFEYYDGETNTEIPLIEDSENLEDELFKLARLKLDKNSKKEESNGEIPRASKSLTLFEPSTSSAGAELKRDKIEKWAIVFQRAWARARQ